MIIQKKSTQGFILFLVLIYMQILMQFALQGWLQLSFLHKKIGRQIQNDKDSLLAKEILITLEKKIKITRPSCLFTPTSPLFFIKKNLNWWKEKACTGHFKEVSYYYVAEILTEVDCLIFERDFAYYATFYRLTLFMPQSSLMQGHIIYQSVIPVKKTRNPTCIFSNSIYPGFPARRQL